MMRPSGAQGEHRWRSASVFSGLSPSQIEALERSMLRHVLKPGEIVFREHEEASSFFVIERGAVDVVKSEASGRTHAIAHVKAGEVLGEMALVGQRTRSATARAAEPTEALELPFAHLEPHAGNVSLEAALLREAHTRMVVNLAATLAERLRLGGERALEAAQARVAMGQFLINALVLLSVYVLVMALMDSLRPLTGGHESYVSVPLQTAFGIGAWHYIRRSGYPLEMFGLTLRRAGRSALEGLLLTLPLLPVVTLGKWLALVWLGRTDAPLWNVGAILERYGAQGLLAFGLVYLVFCAVQEIICRGMLQSALEGFLIGKRRALTAILLSNVLFAVTHLHIGVAVALVSFVPGLYWGWMRRRQDSLVGPTLSHAITGVYAIFVMGWNLGP
jgi:hypothetical protein